MQSRLLATRWVVFVSCYLSMTGCYISHLAAGHLGSLFERQHLEEALEEAATSPEEKERILLVRKALAYARSEGLETSGVYEYYVKLDREVASYLVFAASPRRLHEKTWWFPVVGSVPYLGFFSQEKRDAEAAALERAGYDVYRSSALAYSTLGWFSDPLYSSMLQMRQELLVETVFHELIHRNLWLTDQAKLNENIASFLGEFLAERFLIAEGMEESAANILTAKDDSRLYKKWLQRLVKDLEMLYRSEKDSDQVFEKKREIFRVYTQEKRPAFRKYDFIGRKNWNNAAVLASSLYVPDYQELRKLLHCAVRPKRLLRFVKEEKKQSGRVILKKVVERCTAWRARGF